MAATAKTTQNSLRLDTGTLTEVHWAAIGLAAVTAIVHLYLYWTQEFLPFLLAGLGFLGAVGLVLVGFRRRLIYLAGIPFTAAQIGLWVAQGMPSFELGVFDKAVQLLLIAALVYLYRVDRPAAAATTGGATERVTGR